MYYIERPPAFRAFLYDGTDRSINEITQELDGVESWSAGANIGSHRWLKIHFKSAPSFVVNQQSWIVVDSQGALSVYEDRAFHKKFMTSPRH